MASVTITVPDAVVPVLVPLLRVQLEAAGISTTGMTSTQISRRWVAEEVKRVLRDYRLREAAAAAQATTEAEVGGIS